MIRNLKDNPFIQVFECMKIAFSDYIIHIPDWNMDYWQNRFERNGYSPGLSFGFFENEYLVGYIITCKTQYKNKEVLYINSAGVIPNQRGKGIMPQLMKALRKESNLPIQLEVISENKNAIKSYEKSGFQINSPLLHSYRLEIKSEKPIQLNSSMSIKNLPFIDAFATIENQSFIIEKTNIETTYIEEENEIKAYIIFNSDNHRVYQSYSENKKYFNKLIGELPKGKYAFMNLNAEPQQEIIEVLIEQSATFICSQYEMTA